MSPRKLGRIEVISAHGCPVGLLNGTPCGQPGKRLQIVIEVDVCPHHESLFIREGPSALSLLIVEKVSIGPTNHPRLLTQ